MRKVTQDFWISVPWSGFLLMSTPHQTQVTNQGGLTSHSMQTFQSDAALLRQPAAEWSARPLWILHQQLLLETSSRNRKCLQRNQIKSNQIKAALGSLGKCSRDSSQHRCHVGMCGVEAAIHSGHWLPTADSRSSIGIYPEGARAHRQLGHLFR